MKNIEQHFIGISAKNALVSPTIQDSLHILYIARTIQNYHGMVIKEKERLRNCYALNRLRKQDNRGNMGSWLKKKSTVGVY